MGSVEPVPYGKISANIAILANGLE